MHILIWSIIIFVGRIVDVSLGTIRVNMIIRNKKTMAAVVGFFEVAIFISIIARIIRDFNNLYGILSYAAGFAVGTALGIIIFKKLSHDLISTNIISKRNGNDIEIKIREEGFGVTSYKGNGKDGEVKVINVICRQSYLPRLNELIYKKDSGAFIVSNMLNEMHGGYLKGFKKK